VRTHTCVECVHHFRATYTEARQVLL
jgi:hypothetical protein